MAWCGVYIFFNFKIPIDQLLKVNETDYENISVNGLTKYGFAAIIIDYYLHWIFCKYKMF